MISLKSHFLSFFCQTTTNENGSLVAKPLINLHVTPNGCGLFGCDSDKQNAYPDDYYNYDDFNTRRHQQQRPPSKKNNFFSSSNKPKRHYQPDDFFKPSNQYPDYSNHGSTSQTKNRNGYVQQNSQYQERYGYQQQNNQYDLPQYNPPRQQLNNYNDYQNHASSSSIYNDLQNSNKPVFDALRFSNSENNGFVGNANKNVKFSSTSQDRQPVTQVIRHEHYHFHENSNSNKYQNRAQNRGVVPQLTPAHEGISFGFNDYPGFLNDEPRFRSTTVEIEDEIKIASESDKTSLESENIKSPKTPIGPKQKEKSSFSFPKTQKSLNRSKRDDHPPHPTPPKPAKNIEAVGDCKSNIVSFTFSNNSNLTHLACLEYILAIVLFYIL